MTSSPSVILNGKRVPLVAGETVAALLQRLAIASDQVAVECNREIVPKSQHAQHVLQSGDQLEVVTFVGGG